MTDLERAMFSLAEMIQEKGLKNLCYEYRQTWLEMSPLEIIVRISLIIIIIWLVGWFIIKGEEESGD